MDCLFQHHRGPCGALPVGALPAPISVKRTWRLSKFCVQFFQEICAKSLDLLIDILKLFFLSIVICDPSFYLAVWVTNWISETSENTMGSSSSLSKIACAESQEIMCPICCEEGRLEFSDQYVSIFADFSRVFIFQPIIRNFHFSRTERVVKL